jgi:hypothetical protein
MTCRDEWLALRTAIAKQKSKYQSVAATNRLLAGFDQFAADGCICEPPPVPPLPPGTAISVPAGSDLQLVIDQVPRGTVLLLDANAVYDTNLVLPNKPGLGIVTIMSNQAPPAVNQRVSPATPGLVRIANRNGTDPTIQTAPGAAGYLFVGLSILPMAQADKDLIALGGDRTTQTRLDQQPSDITFDRCLLRGHETNGQHRGIRLNGAQITIKHCHLDRFFEVGRDSQALAGWNGSGPFLIENTYLEASGENFLLGGDDSAIPELMPANLTFRGNHVVKPLAWRGSSYQIKNLFELKACNGADISGNVFENCWVQAQTGDALLFTTRNQENTASWSVVRNVTFAYNVIKNCPQGAVARFLGEDDGEGGPSEHGTNMVFRHNLAINCGAGFLLNRSFWPTTIDHNTLIGLQYWMLTLTATPMPPGMLFFRSNLVPWTAYQIAGDGLSGVEALDYHAPESTVSYNVIEQTAEYTYPVGNSLVPPGTLATRYDPQYRYLGSELGHDGQLVGADVNEILRRIPWAPVP